MKNRDPFSPPFPRLAPLDNLIPHHDPRLTESRRSPVHRLQNRQGIREGTDQANPNLPVHFDIPSGTVWGVDDNGLTTSVNVGLDGLSRNPRTVPWGNANE